MNGEAASDKARSAIWVAAIVLALFIAAVAGLRYFGKI